MSLELNLRFSGAERVEVRFDAEDSGTIECEFLRPATIDALTARLDDDNQPPVDIVHFDGHGVFDADGRTEDPERKSSVVRECGGQA